MAYGYLSTNNGDGIICGCACGPNIYGEEIVFDLSGIGSCGCTEDALNPGTFYSLDLPDGYPPEVTLTYTGGSQWDSASFSVATEFYVGSDNSCPDPDEGTSTFQVAATCQMNDELPHFGELRVLVIVGGSNTVYEGYFAALGETAPNVNICGQPTSGPGFFMAIMAGGNGEISAPV